MKIQINNLEALERLIGDDKEMEIQVKSSIINEFAKRHIKSVANSEIIKNIETSVLNEMKKTNYFGLMQETGSGWNKAIQPSSALRDIIEKSVVGSIDTIIRTKITEHSLETEKKINERLDYLAGEVERYLRDEIAKNKIDQMVQARLKDLLNVK